MHTQKQPQTLEQSDTQATEQSQIDSQIYSYIKEQNTVQSPMQNQQPQQNPNPIQEQQIEQNLIQNKQQQTLEQPTQDIIQNQQQKYTYPHNAAKERHSKPQSTTQLQNKQNAAPHIASLQTQCKMLLTTLFASTQMSVQLMLFYAIVIGGATFVEKYYGTIVAVDVIYGSWWFELLNIWLGILLLTCLIQGIRTKKARFGMQLFHCAFLVALVGAAITRYYGFEGRITLQNGETSNVVLSRDRFLNVFISEDIDHISSEAIQRLDTESMQGIAQSFDMPLTPYKSTSIAYTMQAYGKTLSIRSIEVHNRSHELSDNLYEAVLEVSYGNEVRYYNLFNNGQILGAPFGDHLVILSWQSKKVLLPFHIQLQKFRLDMYPGSENPSSYSSLVSVIDDELQTNMPYEIYMNHVLDYRGYRFFQENYTTEVITLEDGTTREEHNGTILSVNKDPGKIPTYIAYTMMIIGGIWLLIDSNGRFARLGRMLHDMRALNLAILLGIAFTTMNPASKNLTSKYLASIQSTKGDNKSCMPTMIHTGKIHTNTMNAEC